MVGGMRDERLDKVVMALLKRYEMAVDLQGFKGTLNDYAMQKYPAIYRRIETFYGGKNVR